MGTWVMKIITKSDDKDGINKGVRKRKKESKEKKEQKLSVKAD